MRWKLWLAQSNNGRRLDTLLRGMIVLCFLWAGGVGYGLFRTHQMLSTARKEAEAHRRQIEEITHDLQQKQKIVEQATGLHFAAPDSEGGTDWTDQLGQIARNSHVELEALKMTADEHPIAVSAAPGPGSGGAGGGGSPPTVTPVQNGTPNGSKDEDAGWKKTKFECSIVGNYRALTDFINRLTEATYVVEISDAEMTRQRYDARTGMVELRLHLSLVLYGLPKKS